MRGQSTAVCSNESYIKDNILLKGRPYGISLWDSRVAWSILERLGRLDRGSNPRYPILYFFIHFPPFLDVSVKMNICSLFFKF